MTSSTSELLVSVQLPLNSHVLLPCRSTQSRGFVTSMQPLYGSVMKAQQTSFESVYVIWLEVSNSNMYTSQNYLAYSECAVSLFFLPHPPSLAVAHLKWHKHPKSTHKAQSLPSLNANLPHLLLYPCNRPQNFHHSSRKDSMVFLQPSRALASDVIRVK